MGPVGHISYFLTLKKYDMPKKYRDRQKIGLQI